MEKLLTVILLPLCFTACAADSRTTTPQSGTFDVRVFGARGDGKTLETSALQKALTQCGNAGGGTVRIPLGTYLSQPLTLGNNTTLLLEAGATLLASGDHKHFMKTPGDWLKAQSNGDFVPLLSGRDLTNITITGEGTIDGNGAVWWEEAEKARQKVAGYTLPRPNLVMLQRCRNVKVTGIKLQNSPKFHFVPTECEDVWIERVTVLAPEGAANTDGIDPSNCRNVTITRCVIDVGDDNVAIKSGKKLEDREFGCENITVTDCTFKHGHGMSIGSETVGGVHHVLVKNCTFEDTDNGLRIKSRRGRGGRVEDITYADCTLKNCHPAISIMNYYQNLTHGEIPKENKPEPMTETTPRFGNITIRNVVGTSTREVGLIVGLPESPVTNMLLENLTLSGKEGLTIANARGVALKNVKVSTETGEPVVRINAEVTGLPVKSKEP